MINENRFYQEKDWVFIAIPKNASTTILKAIGYDFHQEKSSLISHKELSTYTSSFAVLRNPFERLVSCYVNRILQHRKIDNKELLNTSWTEFVNKVCEIPDEEADEHFRSQTWFLDKVDQSTLQLFHMESLGNSWNEIEAIVGRKLEFNHSKKSGWDNLKQYYKDDRIREKVIKRYQNDLDLRYYHSNLNN